MQGLASGDPIRKDRDAARSDSLGAPRRPRIRQRPDTAKLDGMDGGHFPAGGLQKLRPAAGLSPE